MAAYAPSLEACDIDRMKFLHLIDECNSAFQGNKVLAGVQVVSFGVAFTPELIVMGVATAIQAGAYMANKAHVQHKYDLMFPTYVENLEADINNTEQTEYSTSTTRSYSVRVVSSA